jgi:hypothetical protein
VEEKVEAEERKDTFFVRPRDDEKTIRRKSSSDSLKFPDGRTVHALKRRVFDEAMQAVKKK